MAGDQERDLIDDGGYVPEAHVTMTEVLYNEKRKATGLSQVGSEVVACVAVWEGEDDQRDVSDQQHRTLDVRVTHDDLIFLLLAVRV